MRPCALCRAPLSLALGSLFCGVAALRDVEGVVGELMMTSPQPGVEPAPPCNVPGSSLGLDGGEYVCSCIPGERVVDRYGVPCFDEQPPAWSPRLALRRDCSCAQSTCITRVYGAILLQPLDIEQAKFPKALPGLLKKDLQCLVSTDVEAYEAMGPFVGGGITETDMWAVRDSGDGAMLAMRDIEFTVDTNLWIIGDLHGRLGTLRQVHRDWNQADKQPYVVGLGDMIDRGNRQLEVIAGMVAWRALHRNKVSFVRGNHESKKVARAYGFKCIDTYFDNAPYQLPSGSGPSDRLYNAFVDFFGLIPAALRIKQPTTQANAVFMHGSFGPAVLKKLYEDGSFKRNGAFAGELDGGENVLDEFLWSEQGKLCKEEPKSPGKCDMLLRNTDATPIALGEVSSLPAMFASMRAGYLIDTMFLASSRGAGFYRTRTATRMFMKLAQSCMLITGHTHVSEVELISPDPTDDPARCTVQHEGREQAGYTQASILSAHNFWRHSDIDLEDDLQIGVVGLLSVVDGMVQYHTRPVFPAGAYDLVSQTLDVGVDGGKYPTGDCEYLELDGHGGYKCSGKKCPARYITKPVSDNASAEIEGPVSVDGGASL